MMLPPVLNSRIWSTAVFLFLVVAGAYEFWYKPDPLDYIRVTVNYLPVRDRDIRAKVETLSRDLASVTKSEAQLRKQAIDEIIEERLIEYQAALVSKSPNEILAFIEHLNNEDVPPAFKKHYAGLKSHLDVQAISPSDWLLFFKKEIKARYINHLKVRASIVDRSILESNP